MPDLSRRDFLKFARDSLLALSGLLGLGGLIQFLDYQTEPPAPTDFDLGPASNYPAETRKIIAEVPALLIHNASGFNALSLVCTHLGCTVEEKAEGFSCPCHGSHFDPQGEVTRGPALKPLRSLRVETTEDGHLHLYTA
jgi:cytochrome b6-f complex iron-sulfur subunit